MALREAKERVSQLENAIKRLDSVKKHLNRNASDIKGEIHASVSRNLECLRGREVNLLSQVDQVLGVKEETLQHQQARLNQALGVLQTGLSMVLDDKASEKQLADTLEKLNRIELSPEETPYISFRADHVNLRETILNYGRVDANGLPLVTAFDDPGNPSASLPRHVEEYEDVDHHVFYKTLEEVKRDKSSASSINVTIPKLSTRVEDWLQKKAPAATVKSTIAESPAKRSPAIRPSTLTNSGDTPTLGLSRTSTPGSSCSLNNWLNIIKQHADLEEEHDFEIVDNSCSQKALSGGLGGNNNKADTDFFHHIEKDLKAWLFPDSSMPSAFTADFFRHIPNDTKIWLLQARRQLNSLEDLKQQDFFHHISKEPSTWLRSRAHGKQLGAPAPQEERDGSDFFAHISKKKECWLLNQKKTAQEETKTQDAEDPEEKPVSVNFVSSSFRTGAEVSNIKVLYGNGKWLSDNIAEAISTSEAQFQLKDVCRANETCACMSECISKPDCMTLRFQENSPVKNTVDPSEAFKPLSLPTQDWLSPSSGSNMEKSMPCLSGNENKDVFGHIQGASDPIWLMTSTPSSSIKETAPTTLMPAMIKDDKEETNLWLWKANAAGVSDSSASTTESVSSSSAANATDFCISDWLMVSADDRDTEKHLDDKESEGWSICSEPHSLNTEQYAKDVAVADEYINKWLL